MLICLFLFSDVIHDVHICTSTVLLTAGDMLITLTALLNLL
jgi:hypothetical protein